VAKETVTLFYGESSDGETVELLVLRRERLASSFRMENSAARQNIPTTRSVQAPALFDLVAALIRTHQTSTFVSSRH